MTLESSNTVGPVFSQLYNYIFTDLLLAATSSYVLDKSLGVSSFRSHASEHDETSTSRRSKLSRGFGKKTLPI